MKSESAIKGEDTFFAVIKPLTIATLLLFTAIAWNYLRPDLLAASKTTSYIAITAAVAIMGIVRFNRPILSNVLICPLLMAAAVCMVLNRESNEPHVAWLMEMGNQLHMRYETASKMCALLSTGTLIVALNVVLDCLFDLRSDQQRTFCRLLRVNILVVTVLIVGIWMVRFNEKNFLKSTPITNSGSAKTTEKRRPENRAYENVMTAIEKATMMLGYVSDQPSMADKKLRQHHFDATFDVRKMQDVSAEDLNTFLRGVLRGKGEVFVKTGKKYHLDPLFLASIAMHESDRGTSSFARKHNNPLGVMCGKDSKTPKDFDCVNDAIDFMAGQLARSKRYVKGGNCTVGEIQKAYCPLKAKNDPKKLNKYWLSGVLSWMNKIEKKAEKPAVMPSL